MYARREKQKPFRPSASFKALETTLPKFEKSEPVDPDEDLRVKARASKPDFVNMVDAETGEPLEYTKATWTPQEGRLSMTARIIIDMGTGKLDLKNRTTPKDCLAEINRDSSSSHVRRHPLIDEFLAKGPLTPMYHVNWDPLTNEIDHSKPVHPIFLEEDEHMDSNTFGDASSMLDTASALTTSTANSSTSSMLFLKRVVQPVATVHRMTSKKPMKPLADAKRKLFIQTKPNLSEVKDESSTKPQQSSFGSPVGLEEADRFPLPIDLGETKLSPYTLTLLSFFHLPLYTSDLLNARSWENLHAKTYSDLISLATALERNKSLTKQAPYPGGMSGLRRTCHALA